MSLNDIRDQIEQTEERRRELWQQLSDGHERAGAQELAALEKRLEALWNDYRALRARIRFGDPTEIVRRARLEERLERAA